MEFPSFPLYPKDFLSDKNVVLMTTEEIGAYFLLLCYSWQSVPPGSLPFDDTVLARISRLSPDRWNACRPALLACFSESKDGTMLYQKRLQKEYRKLTEKRSRRSEAGQKAAEERWDQDWEQERAKLECERIRLLCDSHAIKCDSGSGNGLKGSSKEGGLGEGNPALRDFLNSPAGLAQEFCFYQKPHGRDNERKVLDAIEELVREGVPIERIASEIRNRKSRRLYFWQIEKQLDHERDKRLESKGPSESDAAKSADEKIAELRKRVPERTSK